MTLGWIRPVAVKVLTGAVPLGYARLLREARAAAALDHANICPIYEVGEDQSRGFIVMPLLQVETLAARLGRGALNLPEALMWGCSWPMRVQRHTRTVSFTAT